MSFRTIVDQDQRLVMLRALADQTDATLNESLLQRALDLYGHHASRDAVKAHLRWLDDVGAVRLTEVEGFLIARLTDHGLDHVERRVAIDGIAKQKLGST